MTRVSNEVELISSARHIDPGESCNYTLGWFVTKADTQLLGLKLARHRTGSTFRVIRLDERTIRVEATESRHGFTITGSPPVDLRALERELGQYR